MKITVKTIRQNNIIASVNGVDSNNPDNYNSFKALKLFKDTAKRAFAGAKGKATIPAVKRELKLLKANEYFVKWQKDTASYKDDSIEIFYK